MRTLVRPPVRCACCWPWPAARADCRVLRPRGRGSRVRAARRRPAPPPSRAAARPPPAVAGRPACRRGTPRRPVRRRRRSPFATVVKDASRIDGLLNAVAEGRKGLDRAEARATSASRSSSRPKIETGIGEGALLRRARWTAPAGRRVPARAQPGAAAARNMVRRRSRHARGARRRGRVFAQPAGRAPVVSQPHPERKTVLVEATRCSSATCWASA